MQINDLLKEGVLNSPLSLLAISEEKLIQEINDYLPYSIGMEFECHQKKIYNSLNFERIPDILDVNVDDSEQRYRIPNGLKGLVCLWNICEQLKLNSDLDMSSSVHFHFDMTEIYAKENLIPKELLSKQTDWIIEELKKWQTALDYTNVYSWIRYFNALGTLEIRIGEPTFDYEILIKRVLDGCRITKQLKTEINIDFQEPIYQIIDKNKILEYIKTVNYNDYYSNKLQVLNERLKELEKQPEIVKKVEINEKEIIKSRIQRI